MPFAGRGGAGNIQAVQNENDRIAADLEAGRPTAETYAAEALQPRPEQQYAHSGRGGAGNYYSPKELKEQGTYQDTNMSEATDRSGNPTSNAAVTHPIPIQGNKTLGSETQRTYGRGGAGNIMFDSSGDKERLLQKKLAEDEAKRATMKADIERGVQESLTLPPKAKLPDGRYE